MVFEQSFSLTVFIKQRSNLALIATMTAKVHKYCSRCWTEQYSCRVKNSCS